MDREAWRAAIHGVAKRWTQLSDWTELMTKDVEHLLYTFFGEMSFQVLCSFFNYIVFLMLSFRSSLHILDIKSLSDMWFAILSPICGLLFHFLGDVIWHLVSFNFHFSTIKRGNKPVLWRSNETKDMKVHYKSEMLWQSGSEHQWSPGSDYLSFNIWKC